MHLLLLFITIYINVNCLRYPAMSTTNTGRCIESPFAASLLHNITNVINNINESNMKPNRRHWRVKCLETGRGGSRVLFTKTIYRNNNQVQKRARYETIQR